MYLAMKKLLQCAALPLLIILFTSCSAFFSEESVTFEGASAHWIEADRLIWDAGENAVTVEIRYSHNADITITDGEITGGTIIPASVPAELTEEQAAKYPHIASWPVYTVEADRDIVSEAIKGQIVAAAFNEMGELVSATRVQFPGVIDQFYAYDGTLGPEYHPAGIRLTVWAPTAQELSLKLYDSDKNPVEEITTEPSENGVWTFEGPVDWDGMFYRFNVTVFHHETGNIEQYEVTDPYSVSLSTDSHFSQFADIFGDASLKPSGWDSIRKRLPAHTDITLYEAHMRDFSVFDESVPEEHRGKYLAFTHNGKNGNSLSNGMNHLIQLAKAGLTHIHLLPLNDIATVIENKDQRIDLHHPFNRICDLIDHPGLKDDCEEFGDTPIKEVFAMLAEDDPVTTRIQQPYDLPGRYDGMAARDGFNWGYDPFHFNASEGSYATDPDGTARILELREMVKSLHEIGLKIVVDVVYNHTFASGLSRISVLDRIVPGYYHRYDVVSGDMETSTCCDNTAAEHYMMEKLLIDSVLLWAEAYKIDSFRFDLMGHHPRYVMENLMEALTGLTLAEHGVDGRNIYVYGEGWNFGEVANDRIFVQATQFNMGGTGIGNFNDRSRDAIRGGNFTDRGRFQGFSNGMFLFPNEEAIDSDENQLNELLAQSDRIRVGMAGNLSTYRYINRDGEVTDGRNEWIGFALQPQESVNYIDKHDNETLWDNTQTKLPLDMDMDTRVRIQLLSQAFINYGQGIPFHQMGSEILRSKSLDRNSFDSGDWFNAVDFSMESHNWGIGLPPGWDNRNRWDDMKPFLTNETISVEKEHKEYAFSVFKEQLQVRYSSPLFRLPDAESIHKRLKYHNTGPNQIPGIIAMSISDGTCAGAALDRSYDGVVVVFNAHIEEQSIDLGITGMELHPVLIDGTDEVVKAATEQNGVFTVPAHTAAVFVKPQSRRQGEFVCNEIED